MAFLHPGVLWGLLALSVPIIIHFFNLQRPKQVLFSNVAFVKEVKKSVVRRVKFRQWLLLLARLLAVAAMVLAFANPVIVDENKAVLQGNRSIAIVVDNSYSMTAGNERGEYFHQAVSLVRNIIKAYSREDEFLVMTTDNLRLNGNFSQQEEVLEDLKDLEIEQNIHSHTDILSFREEIFSRAGNQIQELYFLSDFQNSTVMADSQLVVLADSSTFFIKYIPLASRAQKNVYIRSHQIVSQIIESGKPVVMNMELVNDGNSEIRDLSVRVMLEGKVAAISTKTLDPESVANLEISFTPSGSGWQSGYIELDDQWVDFDNRRYITLYVPEQEKVLLVEGQSSPNMKILYESLFDQFETTIIPARNIATVELSDYRSLIFLGVKDISTGLADKMSKYLDQGGSLMMFPGDNMNLASVNQFFNSVGLGTMGPTVDIQNGSKAGRVDLAHPVFEGIFARRQNQQEFDAPTIYKYHTVQLNNTLPHNRIMSLENQAPIFIESKVSNGLVFTFTIFPGDTWTDFHVKTIFTPVMFRTTQIMNQTQNVQSGQEIGFYKPMNIPTTKKALINLIDAEGNAIPPEQYARGGATTLSFEKMDIREGNYDIVQEEELLEKISFNISDQESRLKFLSRSELEERLTQTGLGRIEVLGASSEEVKTRIEVEKDGFPLWKYFIIIALICLGIEVLILQLKDRPVKT